MNPKREKNSDTSEVMENITSLEKNFNTLADSVKKLGDLIKQINEMITDLRELFNSANEKIKVMEQQRRGQVEVNVKHGKAIADQLERSSTANKNYEMLKEQFERFRRSSNIVLYGVPENVEGAEIIVNELLQIIAPSNMIKFNIKRIGIAADGKERPLRVYMSSPPEVNTTLSRCNMLKGIEKFKSISVTRDKTKMQLEQLKMRYNMSKSLHNSTLSS